MLIPMMPFFASEMVPATLTTYAADTYSTAGELVPGTSTATTIRIIAPQPIKADELQMLEDGERISDYVRTYSNADISTRVGTASADHLTVFGKNYKVVQVEDRPIGEFRKIIMRRLDA